jgi:hypothetical protein
LYAFENTQVRQLDERCLPRCVSDLSGLFQMTSAGLDVASMKCRAC